MKFIIERSVPPGAEGIPATHHTHISEEMKHANILVIAPGHEYCQDIASYMSSLGVSQAHIYYCLDCPSDIEYDFVIIIKNQISSKDDAAYPGSEMMPRLRCVGNIIEWFMLNKGKLKNIPRLEIDFVKDIKADFLEGIIIETGVSERPENNKAKQISECLLHFYQNVTGQFFDPKNKIEELTFG